MTIETIGSFLPDESLISARHDFERGIIDRLHLTAVEDDAVRDIVGRQIRCGVPFVTSGVENIGQMTSGSGSKVFHVRMCPAVISINRWKP